MKITEAKKLLDENCAFLLDIRERQELEDEGIAESAKWLPLSSIKTEEDLEHEIKNWDKNKSALIYCRSGGRAGRLVEILSAKGIKAENVGGLKDWREAGHPIKDFIS